MNYSRKGIETGTSDLLNDAVTIILVKKMREIFPEWSNSSNKKMRDSEIQPTMFFTSCVHSLRKPNWEMNLLSLRKFYHDIELPFFDEAIDPTKSVLSVLMHLAIRFDINPIFRVEFREGLFELRKSYAAYPHKRKVPQTVPDMVARWKGKILELVRNNSNELQIIMTFRSIFEVFRIEVDEDILLRVGRNYHVIQKAMLGALLQANEFETFSFDRWSRALNSTYFDFFDRHMGNLAILKKNHQLKLVPSFFEPLALITADSACSKIFIDFLVMYIIQHEFVELIGRTGCAHLDNCDKEEFWKSVKLCAALVSGALSSFPTPPRFLPSESC